MSLCLLLHILDQSIQEYVSSFEERMKSKKWGGGLNIMGLCFSASEEDQGSLQKHQHVKHDTCHKKNQNQHHGQSHPVQESQGGNGIEKNKGSSTSSFRHTAKDVKELRQNPGYSNVDIFTFEEMQLATKQFRPDLVVGEGGFGVVYKGIIDESVRPGYKTVEVAIKQLNPNGFQGDKEWLAEVNYLGQLSHPNLVKLIGYCCEGDQRLLVYEYMSCGCLEKHLFRRMSATLTWVRRLKIALDAARGLAFLHGLEQSIIYRDFKTSNILLDKNFNGKLSDFGLAKEGPMGDQTHVSTRVMGTYGYAAPEYIMTGRLTAQSDVYGYGVVLLEMLIGKKALDMSRPSREHNLVEWCRPLLNNNKKLPRILDTRIEGQYSLKDMMRVANLAYQCLSSNPKGRPLMSQVVEILETVYEQERSQGGETLFDNGGIGGGVTLFEAPNGVSQDEARREGRARSKSESENGYGLLSPSPGAPRSATCRE